MRSDVSCVTWAMARLRTRSTEITTGTLMLCRVRTDQDWMATRKEQTALAVPQVAWSHWSQATDITGLGGTVSMV